ncbi:MAG: guanylate kinase [bacterium]|nr:guanylate kinase [bacterium]
MLMNTFVVISSPSGGGKDAVIRKLMTIFPNSGRLVTTTSRQLRQNDVDGVNYNFVSKEDFEIKINHNEFIEHNFYNGNYYGVDRVVLDETLQKYGVVFTNIDVNGKANLDKKNIEHLSIFLLPESLDILENRIKKRGGVSEEDLLERLKTAEKEIEMADNYDYKVVNKEGQIDVAVSEIVEIIKNHLITPDTKSGSRSTHRG